METLFSLKTINLIQRISRLVRTLTRAVDLVLLELRDEAEDDATGAGT